MRNGVKSVIPMVALLLLCLASPVAAIPVYYTGGGTFYDNSLQANYAVSASMTVNNVLMRLPGEPVALAPGETLPGGQYFFEIQEFALTVEGNGQLPTRSGTLNFEGMNDTVWDASWSAGSDNLLSALNWSALDAQGALLPTSLTQYAQLAPKLELFAILFDFNNPVTNISMQRAPVPEPTTIVLVGLGLVGVFVRKKRFLTP